MAVEMLHDDPVFESGEEGKLLVRSQKGSVTFSVRGESMARQLRRLAGRTHR